MTTPSPQEARKIAKEALDGTWKRAEPLGTPINGGK